MDMGGESWLGKGVIKRIVDFADMHPPLAQGLDYHDVVLADMLKHFLLLETINNISFEG